MILARITTIACLSFASLLFTTQLTAVTIGASVKDFALQGHDGKTYKLSDYQGQKVVLEWFNDDCPYVEKHYGAGNMQRLQTKYTEKGVIWFSIISSAPGKQGYVDSQGAKTIMAERKSKPTAILFDPNGATGQYFGAKTTPHMYIIDQGKLAYTGAIDNQPSAKMDSLKGATPLFANALDAVLANKPVQLASNKPYGCSVKYK